MNNVEGANGELRRGEGGEERGGVEERRREEKSWVEERGGEEKSGRSAICCTSYVK